MSPRPATRETDSERILGDADASLLDVVDNVLNKGVVLTGDVTIGLAGVDLVYARLSLLLCAADRVLPTDPDKVPARGSARTISGRIRAATSVFRAEPSHVRNAHPLFNAPPARSTRRG
jgi:hypothetical protein